MTVTKIAELSKARSRIYIDEQPAFVLYKGELRHYHIKEGSELSEGDYDEIMHTILPKRAKLRCMNLLKSREYTEKKLRDKLRQGSYPENIIEEAIAYVKGYHYVDDERYARQFIEYHIDVRSRRRIENDLAEKGIAQEVVRKAFAELEEDGITGDEEAMIEGLLCKRHYDKDNATLQEKQKMYAFLARRGFSHESIRQAVF